ATVASAASNWRVAEQRWRRVGDLKDNYPDEWCELAKAITHQGRHADAAAVLADASSLFPENGRIALLRAQALSASEQWSDAIALWAALRSGHARDIRLQQSLFEAAWGLIGTRGDVDATHRLSALSASNDPRQELLDRFESLGTDEEFGLV